MVHDVLSQNFEYEVTDVLSFLGCTMSLAFPPKELAELLKYDLKERPEKINTAGGEISAFKIVGDFSIGRGGREVEYNNVEICVVDQDIPVL